MPTIMPVSDMQRNFKSVATACAESKEPVYLTRNGYPSLVVMDAEAFENLEHFHKLAYEREKRILERAMEADHEIEAGNGISLEEVRAMKRAGL